MVELVDSSIKTVTLIVSFVLKKVKVEHLS